MSFAAHAERGHARHIRLEGEHDPVIDRTEIVARFGFGDVTVGVCTIGVGDGGQWRIEPRIGPPRSDLRLTNGENSKGSGLFDVIFDGWRCEVGKGRNCKRDTD